MHLKEFFRPPVDYVEPISSTDFSKMIAQFFAIQIVTIATIYGAYHWAGLNFMRDVQYGVFIVALVAELFIYRLFKKNIDYRRRLMDLYPDQPLPSRMHLGVVTWTPFLFFPVMAHMMLARKKLNQPMPWFYRNKLSPMLALFFTHFFVFSLAAYQLPQAALFVSPSMSYMAKISSTARQSISAGQRMKKSMADGNKPAFDAYYMNGDSNGTKTVLGLVSYTGSVIKYSSRVPASEQESFQNENFQKLISFYSQWSPQKFAFSNISFISLLTPTALVEASLLALVDMVVSDTAAIKVTRASEEQMTRHQADPKLIAALKELPMSKSARAAEQSRVLQLLSQIEF
jgi:hypothetical protein